MKYSKNILETIGNTPLIRLNSIVKNIKPTVLAKVESFNPGNSVKDRMALKMIEDAEVEGKLNKGGTIIEGTSGNTGMGLALVAIVKGYKLICVSKKIASETPNSWYVNQYDNLSNTKAHYEQTGPEIWNQTDGKLTHFVVGVGTGGTISGVGKFLKEKNPKIKIYGIDTYGSVFKKYHETGIFDENEIYPYKTEGIGEDIIPKNVDFDIIDKFEKVRDKDAAIYTRKLAEEEGIFAGNSSGAAIKGVLQLSKEFRKKDVVVVLFHDSGSRYIQKIYNDDWMKKNKFI